MGLKQTFSYLVLMSAGILLLKMYSHSHYMLIPYRQSNNLKEVRLFPNPDVTPTSPSQQPKTSSSSSNNCLQFQLYITDLIKSHHPDSAKLLSNTDLFRSTRADAKTNATDCYSDLSLESFNLGLYARAKTVFRNHTCHDDHNVISDYRDLLIYSPYHTDHDLQSKGDTEIHNTDDIMIMSGNNSDNYINIHNKTSAKSDYAKQPNNTGVDLVLLTSMYHSTVKQYLFINTLLNWSNLTAPSRVQPVLFLTHMDIVEKSGLLLYVAYLRGWIIAVAPDCLKSRYPLLHSMFHLGSYVVPNANWYGYANGDIQFTPGFMKTLSKINEYNTHMNDTDKPIVFISSKRTDVYVPRGQLYTDPYNIITLSQRTKPRGGIAVDLFVYHRNSTEVFKKMPRFAVGRRGYDNWLIYDILHRRLGAVDITGTSPMVHLGIRGLNVHENSHRTRKEDGEYNMHIINHKARHWVRKVENIATVSQLGRTSGGSGLQGGGDLYRQWLAEEHNDVKFSLKSRNAKITYL